MIARSKGKDAEPVSFFFFFFSPRKSVLRLHSLPEKSEPLCDTKGLPERASSPAPGARGEAPFGLRDRFCEADAGARGPASCPERSGA